MQRSAEHKFVVALTPVNQKKNGVRSGGANDENEALAVADAQLAALRSGSDVAGMKPSDVYGVFVYAVGASGKPDRVVRDTLVRPVKRPLEPSGHSVSL